MPGDPDKKGSDRKFVSQQPHGQAYQKKKSKQKDEANQTASIGSSDFKKSHDKRSQEY